MKIRGEKSAYIPKMEDKNLLASKHLLIEKQERIFNITVDMKIKKENRRK